MTSRGEDGQYAITSRGGDGPINVRANAPGYPTVYWNSLAGSFDSADAELLYVLAGTDQVFEDINFVLMRYGSISGEIHGVENGNILLDPGCIPPCQFALALDGTYAFSDVTPRDYTTTFDEGIYPTHYWTPDGGSMFASHAVPVQVGDGENVTGIDFLPRTYECRNDANGDGHIDIMDIARILTRLSSRPGDARWLARSDLNGNGRVEWVDLWLVAFSWVRGECRP